ncbi:isthmin-1 isoform X2 [Oncorhynchus mykiss]|uniref:isthmin-1 isoform X2 n=1 Tax=Oncorhynchus mykiss TaxID=8022 RepID=UPI0018781AD8|nr:isthmin-1 isoform X2 [Oncorhynchus mykiss]
MVRLAAELLLLLGLLLLTLHITVLRSSPLHQGNFTLSQDQQDTLLAENNVREESSSSAHQGPGERRGPEHRSAQRPAALPWAQSQATGGSLQKDGPGAFLLDLSNFPDLSKADINRQNPNIQVTIEVVDGLEAAEPEKGLKKENKQGWAAPNWRNWWKTSSTSSSVSTPRRPEEQAPYRGEGEGRGGGKGGVGNTEDSNFLKPLGDWERRGGTGGGGGGGTSKAQTEYGIEDAFKTAATEVSLLAGTDEFNATELFGVDTDSCERWMNCKSEFLKKYMTKVSNDLPSCPCSYPTEVAYSTADVPDPATRRDFRWKDASGPKEKLEIYKPTARCCIRSVLTLESTTLAAQHCCYSDNMKLITRGKGAGTPNLISNEFSADLHYKVDVLPWIICKGDWSRYNQVRPPNNGQKCPDNPLDEDYHKQVEDAPEF